MELLLLHKQRSIKLPSIHRTRKILSYEHTNTRQKRFKRNGTF
jgi:hypothetical protein